MPKPGSGFGIHFFSSFDGAFFPIDRAAGTEILMIISEGLRMFGGICSFTRNIVLYTKLDVLELNL